MAFEIIFCDSVHNTQIVQFDAFDEAADYWQTYADVETCFAGQLKDLDTGEIIWEFDES